MINYKYIVLSMLFYLTFSVSYSQESVLYLKSDKMILLKEKSWKSKVERGIKFLIKIREDTITFDMHFRKSNTPLWAAIDDYRKTTISFLNQNIKIDSIPLISIYNSTHKYITKPLTYYPDDAYNSGIYYYKDESENSSGYYICEAGSYGCNGTYCTKYSYFFVYKYQNRKLLDVYALETLFNQLDTCMKEKMFFIKDDRLCIILPQEVKQSNKIGYNMVNR